MKTTMTDAKDEEQKRGERQRGLSSSDEVALKNEWNLSGAEPVVLPSPCKSAWLASVHQRLSPTVHVLWGLAWAWQMPKARVAFVITGHGLCDLANLLALSFIFDCCAPSVLANLGAGFGYSSSSVKYE